MDAWSNYSRFVIALFAILTPFAALPIFLSLTDGQPRREQDRTARLAALTVAVTLILALMGGDVVLSVLGTSLASFRVGGGIILLLMALSMLSARISTVQHTLDEGIDAGTQRSIGVVPIGLPLLAGPGAISTVIIEGQRDRSWEHLGAIGGCIVFVALLLYASLTMAVPIGRLLGRIGLNIVNRLFGLLLAAIAVELIATGMRALFPGLGAA